MLKKKWHYLVDDDTSLDDRGCCLYLTSDTNNHVIYWDLKDGRYLEVKVEPDKMPRIQINVLRFPNSRKFIDTAIENFPNFTVAYSRV